jgi:2-(1,2-epoxy-1,2-dihydrophenyl)acetyl-CoA isomerase
MNLQTEAVVLDIADGVGTINLNRPKAYNALNIDLAEGLRDAVIRCDEDANIRAVMITGNGPAFCSGGDIRQMMEAVLRDGHAGSFLKTLTVSLHATIATMVHMAKPVITAVNRAAAGAGFSLALAGDLVLAADNARFTVAYTAIGLAPDGSSTFTLPRLIGAKRALELMYTNRPLSAAEAKELGITTRCCRLRCRPARAGFCRQPREWTDDRSRSCEEAGHAQRAIQLRDANGARAPRDRGVRPYRGFYRSG